MPISSSSCAAQILWNPLNGSTKSHFFWIWGDQLLSLVISPWLVLIFQGFPWCFAQRLRGQPAARGCGPPWPLHRGSGDLRGFIYPLVTTGSIAFYNSWEIIGKPWENHRNMVISWWVNWILWDIPSGKLLHSYGKWDNNGWTMG